jgi:hypothetical protein
LKQGTGWAAGYQRNGRTNWPIRNTPLGSFAQARGGSHWRD